jgi:hypothetical protein
MLRPLYTIAHRVNEVQAIARVVASGVNAVECDVRSHVVDHDGTFPWSTRLLDWLDEASRVAARYEHFSFVYFDVKEPRALPALVPQIRSALHGRLSYLFSIADFDDRSWLDGVLPDLQMREGVAIDALADVDAYCGWLQAHAPPVPSWYSFGTPARKQSHSLEKVMPSIQSAISRPRAQRPFSKVCVWSLSTEPLLHAYLHAGVDALMVERDAITDLLTLAKTAGRRLARRSDDPFV